VEGPGQQQIVSLVRVKCRSLLCIVFALRSAWCDAKVVMTVHAIVSVC